MLSKMISIQICLFFETRSIVHSLMFFVSRNYKKKKKIVK